jgi:hypothetical protein
MRCAQRVQLLKVFARHIKSSVPRFEFHCRRQMMDAANPSIVAAIAAGRQSLLARCPRAPAGDLSQPRCHGHTAMVA